VFADIWQPRHGGGMDDLSQHLSRPVIQERTKINPCQPFWIASAAIYFTMLAT